MDRGGNIPITPTLVIGGTVVLPLLYTRSLNDKEANLISALRSGDVRALSRAISTVENRARGWSDLLKAFSH